MITVLNPVAAVHAAAPSEERRLASLAGSRLGFADNSKFNGRLLLETIEAALVAAHGTRRAAWVVKNATGPMGEEGTAGLAEACDAVIAAIGD